MVSSTISRYSVLEKLGEGGMGVVYKAEDPRLGRYVALKLLPDNFAGNPQVRERFVREARAASTLNHPNICTVYDVGEDDGRVFIAMEFLDGITLRDLIRRGPLKLDELMNVAGKVLNGLDEAHAEGVIHRDIKPANIFITKKGAVKILDFGLAKMMTLTTATVASEELRNAAEATQLTSGWGALGTTAYMSPEQALGKTLDARTDLFSFGIVLYEMATGRPPFRGDTTGVLFLAVVQAIPEAPRQLNPDVPEELQRIISKCLEKDREQRYQNAGDIRTDLQRLQPPSGSHQTVSLPVNHAVAAGPGAAAAQSAVSNSWPSEQEDPSAPMVVGVPAAQKRRRVWKATIPAATSLLLLIVGAGLYFHSRRPGIPKFEGGVVLADFVNTTGDSIFNGTLRQALVLDLDQSPFLNVVSDRRIANTLKEMEKPAGERLTREVARQICLRTNSSALIAGSVDQAGQGYLLALNAFNCQTGAVIASVKAEAESRDSVLPALHKADQQLRQKLGEALASLQRFNVPLVEATTVSLQALQAFSQGQAERQVKGSLAGIPYLKRAVDTDPNFAQAHASLGAMYVNRSQWDLASGSFSRAYELRSRVSERERFYIEANYFEYVVRDSDKAVQLCQEWIREYPSDSVPHSRLGQSHLYSGQFEKGTEEYREAFRLGTDTPYSGLMVAYMRSGRLDEAKTAFDAARAHNRDSDFLRLARYTLAFVERDSEGMQEQVDWAKGKAGYEDTLLNAQSDVEAYYGRFAAARAVEAQAKSAAATASYKERAAEYAAHAAWREAEAGNNPLARIYATEALAMSDAPDVRETVAMASARAGDIKSAEKLADQLNAQYPRSTMVQQYVLPTIQGLIEMGKNRPAEAIRVLQPTLPYESGEEGFGNFQPAYVRGLAYMKAGQGQKAAAEFQKLIDHPEVVGTFVTGALAQLQLARAEEMSGNHIAAREHYQNFLALWKDADLDTPVLKQAKAEYAGLKQYGFSSYPSVSGNQECVEEATDGVPWDKGTRALMRVPSPGFDEIAN